MKKSIWIINHYAGSMYLDKGGRHYWFAKYLDRMGYEPLIICSNTLHDTPDTIVPTDALWCDRYAEAIHTPFVFIAGKVYQGNGIGRVQNIWEFYRNVVKCCRQIADKYGKPDVILASSIHPLAPVAGVKIARKFGIKCICEYRDLWPDELICMGAMSENGLPARLLRGIEHWTYKRADALVFTMEGGPQYIRDRGWDTDSGGDVDLSKTYYINNGVDLEAFVENAKKYTLEDPDLLDEHSFKVIYTGMIRRANGIDRILDVAKQLKNNARVRFLLYGPGSEAEQVEQRIREEGISNVIYKGNVNKQYVPFVLSKGDVNILNYMNGDLFRYGCSNNKLFEYMASGKPIICTISMNYSILTRYQCGYEVQDQENSVALIADKIREFSDDPDAADTYRDNAVSAIREFDFQVLTKRLDEVIQSIYRKKD